MSVENALNTAGKVTTSLSILGGILTSIVLFIAIIVVWRYKSTNKYIATQATVKEPDCKETQEENCTTKKGKTECKTSTKYQCDYDLVYSVNGEEIKIKRNSKEGSKLTEDMPYFIEYNSDAPTDVRKPFPYNMVLIILAVVFLISTGGTAITYVMSKNRTYRQFHAGMTGISMVKSQFNDN